MFSLVYIQTCKHDTKGRFVTDKSTGWYTIGRCLKRDLPITGSARRGQWSSESPAPILQVHIVCMILVGDCLYDTSG